MSTEMELTLEQTQQGVSYEVSVSIKGLKNEKRNVKDKGCKEEDLLQFRQRNRVNNKTVENTKVLFDIENCHGPSDSSTSLVHLFIVLSALNCSDNRRHAEFDESNANVLERFYISVGIHVNEILLKLNLPDHRSILTDSKVTLTNYGILKDGGEVLPIPDFLVPWSPALPCKVSPFVEVVTLHLGLIKPNGFSTIRSKLSSNVL
ncbi:hypothetical protein Tco_0578170 [Tanacetum coccineum]